MAEYNLPLKQEGAVATPTGVLSVTTPVEITPGAGGTLDVGAVELLEIPEFGWGVADGVNPLRLIVRDAIYNAGGLAPSAALVAEPSGDQATALFDLDVAGNGASIYNPDTTANSDTMVMGPGYEQGGLTVYPTFAFESTLTAQAAAIVILKGATGDLTLDNLIDCVNGDNEGITWIAPYTYTDMATILQGAVEVESHTTSYQAVFRVKAFGTSGNAMRAYLQNGWATGGGTDVDLGGSGTSGTAIGTVNNFSGGTDGAGSAPAAGTYRYFYTWFRSVDGAETGRSPIATAVQGAAQGIDISSLTDSADTTFDFINIYRTPVSGVEFYQAGSAPAGDTTFTDTLADEDLVERNQWNDLLHRTYAEGMPPRGRALALWKGAIWTTGARLHAEYTRGTVSVAGPDTTASATITFSVQGVTTRMVGREFSVDDTSETYNILSVNETAKTMVLNRPYEGATDGTASFKIRDAYDAGKLRRCVPFLYNQWPVDESPGRIDTDDTEGGTALLATRSRLFGFSRSSIVSVTGDDAESWNLNKLVEGVGCVAPSMVVAADGVGVFLSPDGFYAIGNDESISSISTPRAPKRTVAQGIDGTVNRIAWDSVDQGYMEYDPVDRVVVAGVPLDGASVPNYEIIFDLQNGTWALYKRSEWTSLSSVTSSDGTRVLMAGDRNGNLWHSNIGESDGFYEAEAVQTLSGAQTVRVLSVAGTPFTTDEEGKPVIVLSSDGETVSYGKVASSTTSALTLAEDLATAPVAGDQIVLGGIAWQAKTGYTTFGEEYRDKRLRSATVRHAPTTRGEYHFSFAVDGGSFALCPVGTSRGDLSLASGKVRHKTQWPGDAHAISVRGFTPGGRAVLRGAVLDVLTRENARS